jgi:hypothetical protein
MAIGTSVVGAQVLLADAPRTHNRIGLTVSSFYAGAPRRVGYAYILIVRTAAPASAYLVDRFPVFAPGVFRAIPVLGYGSGSVFQVVVVWNQAAMAWDCSTFQA